MLLISQEHHDLMIEFEKRYKRKPDRESKQLWPQCHIYCNGDVNREFLAYREGYALAKAIYQRRGA